MGRWPDTGSPQPTNCRSETSRWPPDRDEVQGSGSGASAAAAGGVGHRAVGDHQDPGRVGVVTDDAGVEHLTAGHRLVLGHQGGQVVGAGPELLAEVAGRPAEHPAQVTVEVPVVQGGESPPAAWRPRARRCGARPGPRPRHRPARDRDHHDGDDATTTRAGSSTTGAPPARSEQRQLRSWAGQHGRRSSVPVRQQPRRAVPEAGTPRRSAPRAPRRGFPGAACSGRRRLPVAGWCRPARAARCRRTPGCRPAGRRR